MTRTPDYTDTFTVPIPPNDPRSLETLARAGLEESPAPVRVFIVLVHRHVLRFRLRRGPGAVLGWTVAEDGENRLRLEAAGPLFDGVMVATRSPRDRLRLDTSLHFRRRLLSRALWVLIGPAHRLIAPYLLRRAVRRRG